MSNLLKNIQEFVRLCMPSGIRTRRQIRRLQQRAGVAHVASNDGLNVIDSYFGPHCRITSPVAIIDSMIGDYSYIENNCQVVHADVGKYTSIAPGSFIGMSAHPTDGFVSTHPAFYLNRPEISLTYADRDYHREYERTTIGNDVWIGAGVCIKAGVNIGDGAIIGAAAVVTHDVPPYAIVAGVPAKVLRHRFDPDLVQFLLDFKWWDKDDAWIRRNWRQFHDVESFRQTFGRELCNAAALSTSSTRS